MVGLTSATQPFEKRYGERELDSQWEGEGSAPLHTYAPCGVNPAITVLELMGYIFLIKLFTGG